VGCLVKGLGGSMLELPWAVGAMEDFEEEGKMEALL
jgi:hypothetical protein